MSTTSVRPSGIVDSPSLFRPHPTNVLSDFIANEWYAPEFIKLELSWAKQNSSEISPHKPKQLDSPKHSRLQFKFSSQSHT